MAGVPGSADIVKVDVPSAIAAGSRRRGTLPTLNRASPMGASTKKGHEKTDAAISHQGTGQNNGECGPTRSQLLGHEIGDGADRAAVVHQLAEQRSEQKNGKELGNKAGCRRHESLGPVRQGAARRKTRRRSRQLRAREAGSSSRETRGPSERPGPLEYPEVPRLSSPPADCRYQT